MWWVLGALCIGAPLLALAAYWLTLGKIDEVLDDSLKQTALLLADRDLRGATALAPSAGPLGAASTESQFVAIARRTDGSLLFTSGPEMPLRSDPRPGTSIQRANGTQWHVFTVVEGSHRPGRATDLGAP